MKLVVLVMLFVIMLFVKYATMGQLADISSIATISLGFIMVCAFLAGKWILRAGFPLITGYIIAGLFCGPQVLGLFSESVISELKLIDGIALSLIALAAGGEIRWAEVKRSLGGLISITCFQSLLTLVGIFITVILAMRAIPFLWNLPSSVSISAALLLAVIATANSPSTVIAVITELRAQGRVTESILGVTVLKDVLVIIAFAAAISFSAYFTGPVTAFDTSYIIGAFREILVSFIGGVLLGFLLIFYINRVKGELALFMVGIAYLSTELFHHFGLHPLLATVVAGFIVQNFSPHGRKFIESLERASLPVFVIFFAITGAGLDLTYLGELWKLVLLIVIARGFWIFAGTFIGASLARELDDIRRTSWLGYIPQAGVSIGLSVLVASTYPGWGEVVKDLAITIIAINQIIGPIGLKYAIVTAGEAQDRGGDEEEDKGPVTPFHVMIRSYRI
ncbi:MAG: cation:proton antiporter [Candidatus Glassbacteria bacterium]